jgi:uncharacterized protein
MDKILITGGSGLIGKALTDELLALGKQVVHLSRSIPATPTKIQVFQWDIERGYIDSNAFRGVTHIVHLAGESIAAKRWTKNQKRALYSSRINSLRLINAALKSAKCQPQALVSASGINYYPFDDGLKTYKETDSPGTGFLSRLVVDWEDEALRFQGDTRVALLRTGVVLSPQGGALEKMVAPVKYRVGAYLGSGTQPVPWIHLTDLVGIYIHALFNDKIQGAYNAVAPNPIDNRELTDEIAFALNRKILLPPVPSFFLKLALGEMSEIVLQGVKASPAKIIKSGFDFKYEKIKPAIYSCLRKNFD